MLLSMTCDGCTRAWFCVGVGCMCGYCASDGFVIRIFGMFFCMICSASQIVLFESEI